MKKAISLLLAIVLLMSTLMANTTAYAAGFSPSNAQRVELNTEYSRVYSANDPSWYGWDNYSYHLFVFDVPVAGTIDIYIESTESVVVGSSTFESLQLYSPNNLDDYIWEKDFYYNQKYNTNTNIYYKSESVSLSAGSYFLVKPICSANIKSGTYNIILKYTPAITRPITFNSLSRKTTSLGLTWSNVGDVTGYQVQQQRGGEWYDVAITNVNACTVSGLKAGKQYNFRVSAFVDVNGVRYNSEWVGLTTATKPSAPSIKTPSTNSKHQIIVKWNKAPAGSGYQVQFSKKKSFSSVISKKTVSGIKKTSCTGKNFTKGKTYYVRVRTYKTVNGVKYYSSWSKVKAIKCK